MIRPLRLLFCLAPLLFCVVAAHAQSPELRFEDDFEGRDKLGPEYRTLLGDETSWTIRDGVLYSRQTRDDHGAVLKKVMNFDDLDFRFDFRFNGGQRFNVVIDDKNEKTVHAGHICRVSLSPKRIVVGDDKLGVMNLEVRKLRQTKDLSAEKQQELNKILKRTQAVADVNLKKGTWYSLRVTIQNDVMTVYLDGKQIASLTSPGIDHPTKTQLGFTVMGETIDFDNLQVVETASAQRRNRD